MKEYIVNDFSGLQASVKALDPSGIWLFRGQGDTEWDLVPGMFRGLDKINPPYDETDAEWVTQIERNVYRTFNQFAGRHQPTANKWEQLCLAQHYGTPTRLLDWTRLPFVAAYFAVVDVRSAAASIWAFNVSKYPFPSFLGRVTKQYAHRTEVLDSISQRRSPSFFQIISKHFSLPSRGKSLKPLLADEFTDLEEGFLVVLDPPRFDDRIIAQEGLFTLHYSFDDYDLVWNLADYLKDIEIQSGAELLHKITIPSADKEALRKSLEDIAGMNLYRLFPDLVGLGYRMAAERQNDFDFYSEDRK